jgi:predicted nucleic acid-binding protein
MPAAHVYLDSSAIVKLILDEAETHELERFLTHRPSLVCSIVGQVEVLRAAHAVGHDLVVKHAKEIVSRIDFVALDPSLVRHAVAVTPSSVRTLDAIHLATALSLEPDLAGMVVYDKRLADAARKAGLTVWAPA